MTERRLHAQRHTGVKRHTVCLLLSQFCNEGSHFKFVYKLFFFAAIKKLSRQTEEDKLLRVKIIVAFLLVQRHVAKNKFTPVLRSNGIVDSQSSRNYKLCVFLQTFLPLIQWAITYIYILPKHISNSTALILVISTISETQWRQTKHEKQNTGAHIQILTFYLWGLLLT